VKSATSAREISNSSERSVGVSVASGALAVSQRPGPDDRPVEIGRAHGCLLALVLGERPAQQEGDDDVPVERRQQPASVPDPDRRLADEVAGSRMLHRPDDVAGALRADVARLGGWCAQDAEHDIVAAHRSLDRGGVEHVAGKPPEAVALAERRRIASERGYRMTPVERRRTSSRPVPSVAPKISTFILGPMRENANDRNPSEPMASTARARILEAASAMVESGRLGELTMAAVASAAGVSRQTVYVQIGTRAGLLVHMVRERDEANPRGERVAAAMALPDPVDALVGLTRELSGWWREIHPVARALYAAALTDEAARAAWEDRIGHLRAFTAKVVQRLGEAGVLAGGLGCSTRK
jgi:AcrR family transcriptional regulator